MIITDDTFIIIDELYGLISNDDWLDDQVSNLKLESGLNKISYNFYTKNLIILKIKNHTKTIFDVNLELQGNKTICIEFENKTRSEIIRHLFKKKIQEFNIDYMNPANFSKIANKIIYREYPAFILNDEILKFIVMNSNNNEYGSRINDLHSDQDFIKYMNKIIIDNSVSIFLIDQCYNAFPNTKTRLILKKRVKKAIESNDVSYLSNLNRVTSQKIELNKFDFSNMNQFYILELINCGNLTLKYNFDDFTFDQTDDFYMRIFLNLLKNDQFKFKTVFLNDHFIDIILSNLISTSNEFKDPIDSSNSKAIRISCDIFSLLNQDHFNKIQVSEKSFQKIEKIVDISVQLSELTGVKTSGIQELLNLKIKKD